MFLRRLIVALMATAMLLAACAPAPLAAQTVNQNNNQQVVIVVQPEAPAPAPAVVQVAPEATTPTAEAPAPVDGGSSCPGWSNAPSLTQKLTPGQSAQGDVKVNGKAHYDSGTGEATVVRNLSDSSVEITQQWGAGCQPTINLDKLVNNEFSSGCGGNGCSSVRVVDVTNDGISEKFYTSPIK